MSVNPGIHTMPAEQYHADPADVPSLSASIAHLLVDKSPLHAWTAHPKLNPNFTREHKTVFDVGTCAHALLLEGSAGVEIVDAPDWRTKAAKEARDQAHADGKQPLLQKQWDAVVEMRDATVEQLARIVTDPPVFATDGAAEQTLVWEDDGGVICRARADWLHADLTAIDDYKTTSKSAHAATWARGPLFNIGGEIQAAFYLRGLKKLTGADAKWRWVVQETTPPYALSVIEPSADLLAFGASKVQAAIVTWRECLETGVWPAYPPAVHRAEVTGFRMADWLEHEYDEEVAA